MAWKKPKPVIEENPMTAEEAKKMTLPEVPNYQDVVKAAATAKKQQEDTQEEQQRWQLAKVPTEYGVAFLDNETGKNYSIEAVLIHIANELEDIKTLLEQ